MKLARRLILVSIISLTAIFCGTVTAAPPSIPAQTIGATGIATQTLLASTGLPIEATGGISGHLSYPSEFIPELRVVAFDVINPGIYYYVDTVQNQSFYEIDGLPPSTYHVVAYPLDPTLDVAGGYSQFIPCGAQYGCDDHTLLKVVVVSGAVTENIDPNDWYAPTGAFPPRPGP